MKIKSHIEARMETGCCNLVEGHRRASARSQRGASVIEMIFLMTFFSLLLIGVIDIGRALYVVIEVADASRAAAMYGYQTSATAQDSAGITNAAKSDAPTSSSPGVDLGSIAMNTVTSYGCMCSNGTGQILHCSSKPACTAPVQQVNYVIVTTSATYTPLFPWPGVPTSIPISSKSQMFAGQ